MIVDHENRVLIGTPAKTGTISLEKQVMYAPDGVLDGVKVVKWTNTSNVAKNSKVPHGMIVPDGCQDYKRVLVVRQPLERLVSMYYWLRKPYHMHSQWHGDENRLPEMDTFDKFLDWWLECRRVRGMDGTTKPFMDNLRWWQAQPNYWLASLAESKGKFKPHDLIHTETLHDDLLTHVRSDWPKPHHQNRSGVDASWQFHYDDRLLRLALPGFARRDMVSCDYDLDLK